MTAFKALLVPASELLKPTIVPVSPDLHELERYLQGLPEQARYDLDSVLLVNGLGVTMGMARNERVTDYVFTESAAAKRGNFRRTSRDSYYLAGPVVILGQDGDGFSDVPDRLVEAFGVEQARGAEPG